VWRPYRVKTSKSTLAHLARSKLGQRCFPFVGRGKSSNPSDLGLDLCLIERGARFGWRGHARSTDRGKARRRLRSGRRFWWRDWGAVEEMAHVRIGAGAIFGAYPRPKRSRGVFRLLFEARHVLIERHPKEAHGAVICHASSSERHSVFRGLDCRVPLRQLGRKLFEFRKTGLSFQKLLLVVPDLRFQLGDPGGLPLESVLENVFRNKAVPNVRLCICLLFVFWHLIFQRREGVSGSADVAPMPRTIRSRFDGES